MRIAIRAGLGAFLVGAAGCQDAEKVVSAPPPTLSVVALQSSMEPALTIDVKLVAEGLTSPIQIVSADDRTRRLFIIDQAGVIRIVTKDGLLLPTPFLDVRAKMVPLRPGFDERGLLGLAFHPKYRKNGRFFVYYTAPLRPGAPVGYNATARISEFRVSANPNNETGEAPHERYLIGPLQRIAHYSCTYPKRVVAISLLGWLLEWILLKWYEG